MERMNYKILKWYGHVVHMKDNRWPKWIKACSVVEIQWWGRPTVKWGKEVGRVMKERNL
jgi:hypothetical protein